MVNFQFYPQSKTLLVFSYNQSKMISSQLGSHDKLLYHFVLELILATLSVHDVVRMNHSLIPNTIKKVT